MAINIIKEKCIGCGLCFKSCPKDVLYFERYDNRLGKVAAIGPNCDFCNQCLTACKFGAIEEKKAELNDTQNDTIEEKIDIPNDELRISNSMPERRYTGMENRLIKQGVSVDATNVISEQEIAQTVQAAVSKEIARLNAQGKRVINVSAGSAVKTVLGVKHHVVLLWEE